MLLLLSLPCYSEDLGNDGHKYINKEWIIKTWHKNKKLFVLERTLIMKFSVKWMEPSKHSTE